MLTKGSKVKILFRNGMVEMGIIESWSTKQAVLKSVDSQSLLIIQNTEQDIMAIKVIVDSKVTDAIEVPAERRAHKIIKEDHDQEQQYIPDASLRTKKLVELHLEKAELEREATKKNLLKTTVGMTKEVEYGFPSSIFTKGSGLSNNTGKKS